MTRFKTKAELLAQTHAERRRLEGTLALLKPEDFSLPGVNGEWTVKDLLMHLVAWEQAWLGWYAAGLRGETPETPGQGFTWARLHDFNRYVFEKHRSLPLAEVLARFASSHQDFLGVMESLPEEAYFQPGYQPWMGRLTPADFIAANGCNHYLWAKTLLRKWLKNKE